MHLRARNLPRKPNNKVPIVPVCLICNFSNVAICPLIPAVRFAFCLCLFVLFLWFIVVLPGESKQNQG